MRFGQLGSMKRNGNGRSPQDGGRDVPRQPMRPAAVALDETVQGTGSGVQVVRPAGDVVGDVTREVERGGAAHISSKSMTASSPSSSSSWLAWKSPCEGRREPTLRGRGSSMRSIACQPRLELRHDGDDAAAEAAAALSWPSGVNGRNPSSRRGMECEAVRPPRPRRLMVVRAAAGEDRLAGQCISGMTASRSGRASLQPRRHLEARDRVRELLLSRVDLDHMVVEA